MSQIVVCIWGEAAAFADTGHPLSPTNIFAPASTPAKSIFGLSLFVVALTHWSHGVLVFAAL